jgi:hypothetical protein
VHLGAKDTEELGETYTLLPLEGRGERGASSSRQQAVHAASVVGKHMYKKLRGGPDARGGARRRSKSSMKEGPKEKDAKTPRKAGEDKLSGQ